MCIYMNFVYIHMNKLNLEKYFLNHFFSHAHKPQCTYTPI